jgi:tetratricopeptide (TPR) repeat protein
MTHTSNITAALQEKRYEEAEKLATASLRQSPLQAQAWVHLGEALLHQGFGDAARHVFERAWLLDPQAAWVPSVQRALADVAPGQPRPDVHALLRVPSVKVTAAVMTSNDARTIVRCVRSLIDSVDEIVILDSDSTDGTLELIQNLPKVRVIRHIAFDDNFAGKRNQGFSHFTGDWVIWVDADESLFPEDATVVRQAAGLFDSAPLPPILSVCQVNSIQGKEVRDYSLPRMFPLRRGLRYHGRVHEQVILEGKPLFEDGTLRRSVRIRLRHDGYEPDVMRHKDKLNRNLRLLQLMVDEEPDNPGWMLYYGRELLGSGDADRALTILERAEALANRTPLFGRLVEILTFMGSIHMQRKAYDAVEQVCLRALNASPNYPDAQYMLALAQMRKAVALMQDAERHLNQAKASFATYRGTVTADRAIADWKADLALADLALLAGKRTEATRRYEEISRRHPELEAVRKKLDKLLSPE